MPQFTEFPPLPSGEYRAATNDFVSLIQNVPAEGLSFKDFRGRLKKRGIWSRERLPALLRFLQIPHSDPIVPSAFMLSVADADADTALDRLAERLWTINPLLFKSVIDRLEERVHSANELLKYLDSFAYPGVRITGPEVNNWIQFAQGLEVLRTVGIRLALADRGQRFVERAKMMDVDDFLEDDEDEPEALPPNAPAPAKASTTPAAPAKRAAPAPAPSKPSTPASTLPSPLGRGRPVPSRRFAGHDLFPDDVLAETTERLTGWWAEQDDSPSALTLADFGLDGDDFNADPENAVFLVAVAAALSFRLNRSAEAAAAAFTALRDSGALEVLFSGTVPEVAPEVADAQALMLASLVARRAAEAEDLAAQLERAGSARAAFTLLDQAFGRGLFSLELFWMLRMLGAAGLVRAEDLPNFTVVPDRGVRDTLFRLGFLATPYADNAEALAVAGAATRRTMGGALRADDALRAFAQAAGCQFGCPHRRRCDLPCRERADVG